jgi:hypothetical protein
MALPPKWIISDHQNLMKNEKNTHTHKTQKIALLYMAV